MLQIKTLNQFYGESHTLWDVNMDVPDGSCVCLMGRNGVGKTTLLKTIMGLLPIKSGSMVYAGQSIAGSAAEQRARIGIGYVPQGREIFPLLSVEENLQIGLSALGKNKRRIASRIFELFPVLKEMLGRRGGDLSGGQQQQLAIGRALTLNPKMLILDEPTEGIQPNIVNEIGSIIMQLNQQDKMTVLLVEQKLPFARRVGKQYVIMDKGRICASDAMQNLNEKLIDQYLKV